MFRYVVSVIGVFLSVFVYYAFQPTTTSFEVQYTVDQNPSDVFYFVKNPHMLLDTCYSVISPWNNLSCPLLSILLYLCIVFLRNKHADFEGSMLAVIARSRLASCPSCCEVFLIALPPMRGLCHSTGTSSGEMAFLYCIDAETKFINVTSCDVAQENGVEHCQVSVVQDFVHVGQQTVQLSIHSYANNLTIHSQMLIFYGVITVDWTYTFKSSERVTSENGNGTQISELCSVVSPRLLHMYANRTVYETHSSILSNVESAMLLTVSPSEYN